MLLSKGRSSLGNANLRDRAGSVRVSILKSARLSFWPLASTSLKKKVPEGAGFSSVNIDCDARSNRSAIINSAWPAGLSSVLGLGTAGCSIFHNGLRDSSRINTR